MRHVRIILLTMFISFRGIYWLFWPTWVWKNEARKVFRLL